MEWPRKGNGEGWSADSDWIERAKQMLGAGAAHPLAFVFAAAHEMAAPPHIKMPNALTSMRGVSYLLGGMRHHPWLMASGAPLAVAVLQLCAVRSVQRTAAGRGQGSGIA
jgi:hypothetical protein